MRADGAREALRLLLIGRDHAVQTASAARTALASILVTAPAPLREQLRRLPAQRRPAACAAWQCPPGADQLTRTTCQVLASLGQRITNGGQAGPKHTSQHFTRSDHPRMQWLLTRSGFTPFRVPIPEPPQVTAPSPNIRGRGSRSLHGQRLQLASSLIRSAWFWPGIPPHVHPHRGASGPGADLHSIAGLIHDPKPAAAAGRIGGGPDSARQRIGDLAMVLYLANDFIIGDPHRQCPRPAGMSQGVSGQLADRDHQIADPPRRQPSPARPVGGKFADTGQAGPVPEHLGTIGGPAQRPARPGLR